MNVVRQSAAALDESVKHMRAFLSSTFKDLAGHREYVVEQLRKAGFDVDTMEEWAANADAPREFAPQRVAECDLMVLLVAERRGHKPEGSEKSITESEYQAARSAGLDVLPFLLEDDAPWYPKWDERKEDPKLALWRKELQENHGVGYFGLEPGSIPLGPALTRWLSEKGSLSPPPVRGPTKVLILGLEEAGSLITQFRESLSTIRSIECSMVSQDSRDMTRMAAEADVIIVSFHSEPHSARERDTRFLSNLRRWEENLLLFAKDREDLMNVLDEIRLTPDSVFKVKSPEDSERRLLARLLDKHTALVSEREQDAVFVRPELDGAVDGSGAKSPGDGRGQGTDVAHRGPAVLQALALLAVAATIVYFLRNFVFDA